MLLTIFIKGFRMLAHGKLAQLRPFSLPRHLATKRMSAPLSQDLLFPYFYTPLSERLQTALDSAVAHRASPAKRLFLVDAMDPINRAHYAYRKRILSPSQKDTTILFGFMKYLFGLLNTLPTPDYCIVAFDADGADFRELSYPGYKGHREETALEIMESIPMIQKALDLLGIRWIRAHGVEADDVIGSLAKKFASDDVCAYIFSRDKDFLQLLQKNVVMIRGPRKQGIFQHYTTETFRQEFGIDPALWVDVLALQGDDADNIPGVRNIGPKRALKLVSTYGRLEDIFDHTSTVSTTAVQQALSVPNSKNNALLSRDLVTIATDLRLPPLRFPLEKARLKMPEDRGESFDRYAHENVSYRLLDDLRTYIQRLN